jgi:hypothetical protein
MRSCCFGSVRVPLWRDRHSRMHPLWLRHSDLQSADGTLPSPQALRRTIIIFIRNLVSTASPLDRLLTGKLYYKEDYR